MQINQITGNNNVDIIKQKSDGINNSSGAFQAVLEKMLASGQSELPKVWSDNKFGNGAIDSVVSFLSEECGINAYERVPSYELTSSELDWIKSRHSENSIKNLQPFTAEEGNLLGDLVFQNVISPDDAKTLQGMLIPAHDLNALGLSEQDGLLSLLFPAGVEADYFERLDMASKAMEELIGYYSGKQDTASENAVYVRNAAAFSENKQVIKDLLTEIANSY